MSNDINPRQYTAEYKELFNEVKSFTFWRYLPLDTLGIDRGGVGYLDALTTWAFKRIYPEVEAKVNDLVVKSGKANTDVANPPSDPKRKANT